MAADAQDRKLVTFWRGTDRPYGEFCNWVASPFVDSQGRKFANNEQYFMYRKAVMHIDHDQENEKIAATILATTNPKTCKSLGRKVKGFDQLLWDKHKEKIMVDGLMLKFTQNERLKKLLISTGDALIVEASPYDRIWGAGLHAADVALYVGMGRVFQGRNLLGGCLMRVRKMLTDQDSS